MTATDHIRAAARILDDRMRHELRTSDQFDAINSNARIAIALALTDLAAAAKADTNPTPINQQPWPEGVTARILTRLGMRSREFADATVDIHDNPDDGLGGSSTARCRACGWDKDYVLTHRYKTLDAAREHAADCTALPKPNAA